MENSIKNKPNLYDDSKPSIWEVVSEEFDIRHKEHSKLVRGASTPNINNDVSTKPIHTPRMGSHISAKIKQLQLSQEEGRKRHVSESDTSLIMEAYTSAATFKDTRQLVFLDEAEVNTTDILTHNKSFITPVTTTTTSTYSRPSPPVTATITPVSTQKLPFKHNTNYSNTIPVVQQTVIKSPRLTQKKFNNPQSTFIPPQTSRLSPVPSASVGSNSGSESDISQEVIYYQKPPEHLHSETIRIRTASESDQTLELTVTVSQKPSNESQIISSDTMHPSSMLSSTQRMQFSLDDNLPKPSLTPRRSFVFPNFLKLLPSQDKRRNSAPIRAKPSKLPDNEDVEVLNFKLEAVAINAAYLLARAQDFCGTVDELIELEEEIERTQRALDDVEVMAPQNMRPQVARATRALNACKMILEERSPSIETLEVGENRRRSSSINVGDVRSVSMRVMKLNKEEEKRRSSTTCDSTPSN